MKSYSFYHNAAKEALKRNSWPYLKAALLYYGITFWVTIFVRLFRTEIYHQKGLIFLILILTLGVYALCIAWPLSYSFTNSILDSLRHSEKSPAKRMISIFREEWGRSIGTYLLLGLAFTIFIGVVSLAISIPCFIIGHILTIASVKLLINMIGCIAVIILITIFALAVSQIYFIVHDNPEMGIGECMSMSIEIMKGHKGQLCVFYLIFACMMIPVTIILSLGMYFALQKLYILCSFFLFSSFIFQVYVNTYFKLVLASFYRDLISEQTEEIKENIERAENTL